MLLAILSGAAGACVAPSLLRRLPKIAPWLLASIPLLALVYFARALPEIASGSIWRVDIAWLPALGVSLSFALDGLSLAFSLLVAGLGSIITLYACSYMRDKERAGAFVAALLVFMTAMLGVVLADDIVTLFLFWELTGVCSFVLIGHKHRGEEARAAARKALVITGLGGLALLAGLLLLAEAAGGTFSITEILDRGDAVREHALYAPAFVLIALGAFTKSAQFPFHSWLPAAMAAPTPASAYLHSATMVKAGVYLLARFDRGIGSTEIWTWTLLIVGGLTMLIGAVGALRQTDMKKVLAYSTLTALGTLVVLLGLSFPASIVAAVVFLFVHSLYKAALFMIAGLVDKSTGSRDIRQLRGLAPTLPWLAFAAVLAALSMAGLPPMFGFIGKELSYKAKLGFDASDVVLPAIAVLANGLTLAAAAALVVRPFFGRGSKTEATSLGATRLPSKACIGPIFLGLLGLVIGLVPSFAASVVGPAADAVYGRDVAFKLRIWYGATPALLLSGVTIAVGAIAYLGWTKWPSLATRSGSRLLTERAYDGYMRAITATADVTGHVFSKMTRAALIAWAVAMLGALILVGLAPNLGSLEAATAISVPETALAVFTASAALAATLAKKRLTALIFLGAVGFSLSVWFVVLGAIDLAMTQLLVEAIIVVVAVFALSRSAEAAKPRSSHRRLLVSVVAGSVLALVTLAALATPFESAPATYYAENSLTAGYGSNIVNVILVDFRALDTFGEIAVLLLGLVAIGAIGLGRGDRRMTPAPSLILRATTTALVPLLLLYAIFLLIRGHNSPGGGFIAGLVVAAAAFVYSFAAGPGGLARLLRFRPTLIAVVGLALALAAAVLPAFVGKPFFTGLWITVGETKLGSPLLFDLGVFLVVTGFGIGAVSALGPREQRSESWS